MASLLTCLAGGAAWCVCTATASLLTACCGNDKSSDVAPSATSGRKRSVLLLVFTIALAFAFQYGVAPFVLNSPISNFVTDAWEDGCMDYDDETLREKCVGNNGVYRATASALLFFLLAGITAYCKPTANREAWPAKFILFFFLVAATCFVPNQPLFSGIYLQIGRIGAVAFLLIQQVIILDLAFNWNDSWVEKSNRAETEQQKRRWLGAILGSCAILFTGSLVVIVLLFVHFGGCGLNVAFITLTLIFGLATTALQLTGEEASLLSSACVMAYATYLCLIAVSKNPNGQCNPWLGEENVLGIVLGIGFTSLSLGWTGFSFTAEKRVNGNSDLEENLVEEGVKPAARSAEEDRKVAGIVTNDRVGPSTDDVEQNITQPDENDKVQAKPVSWRLNLVLAMISCFIAMALTGWGSIEAGGNAANPDVSRVTMWMVITSQWIVFALYGWILVAPRLFPDRDFS